MKPSRSSIQIVIAGIIALSPVALFAAGPSMNVRGTITRVDGNTLEVNERDGKSAKVRLVDNAKIASVAKASLSDIKPGSFIGTAATQKPMAHSRQLKFIFFPSRCAGPAKETARGTLSQKAA